MVSGRSLTLIKCHKHQKSMSKVSGKTGVNSKQKVCIAIVELLHKVVLIRSGNLKIIILLDLFPHREMLANI